MGTTFCRAPHPDRSGVRLRHPLLVSWLFELITRINSMGTTVSLVEQNAITSLKIAHQAYILESGRIALAGPARDMISNPRIREAYLGL